MISIIIHVEFMHALSQTVVQSMLLKNTCALTSSAPATPDPVYQQCHV